MAFTDTPKLGVNLAEVIAAADVGTRSGHRLGAQVFGSDGKRYVFAEAGASISASTAVVDIDDSTFVAAASGGNYLSPATAMSAGDRGWFAAASV